MERPYCISNLINIYTSLTDLTIEEVEEALVGTDCTFSAFVVEAVKVALENLKEDDEENNQA